MWVKLGRFILKYRIALILVLAAATAFMGYHASKVELSYEFTRAIPLDNPKYMEYQNFRAKFGEDGNLLVVGVQTEGFFKAGFFNGYASLVKQMKAIPAVEDVLNIPGAVNLVKDTAAEKLQVSTVFPQRELSQQELDSAAATFGTLLFYKGLLYNPETHSYLMGIRINKGVLNSKKRNDVVKAIVAAGDAFGKAQGIEMHYSGLPLIRTNMATKIANEMQWFLLGSILLSAVILFLFFRSLSATLLSLGVVIIGVIWSLGTIHALDFKITLLNALIPPLIVVIGIPNCIYFLNKYHTSYQDTGDKKSALVEMVGRMGIVTLFCNIAAAIGFAVFALTRSAILKEFGIVAGFNIMALFFISIIVIPITLSWLKDPKPKHTRYLDNKLLLSFLDKLELWSLHHQKLIYTITLVLVVASIAGTFRLKSEGFIVDDLPQTDKIFTDLKFFEKNFKGVMPLEILVDTKQKNGLRKNMLQTFERIDSLSQYIAAQPEMARPLSIVEGMKFARQAYWDGDSANYGLPNTLDIAFLAQYLNGKSSDTGKANNFNKLILSFMDSTKQLTRISVNMADVGSKRLPELISNIEKRSNQLFDSAQYKVTFTGTSVTFLEGSAFIINGLKESIVWAFLLIAACMLYLFKSFKILIASLIPNVIPLLITAGVMGWTGVPLKPSTVLVFSVALGIAIDITIRFLVNYKQELARSVKTPTEVVIDTIHKTGISIIYTSLVLIAGFVIFCFSGFGGTKALGWLTSLTLVMATLTNLVFLPALLLRLVKNSRNSKSAK
ncbi:MAG: MMPL family transporter [Chitinophagaceae bacterium]|nr:MMPL family transporter [Chitinophagaceae bacterium]